MSDGKWINPPADSAFIPTVCAECGAVVDLAYHELHEKWHDRETMRHVMSMAL